MINQMSIILTCYIIIFILIISIQINDSVHDYLKPLYQKQTNKNQITSEPKSFQDPILFL